MATQRDYLSIPTAALLDCFAAGAPSPGVGSATGFAGAIAAALVETVAQLTRGKTSYAPFHARALEIQERARYLRTLLTNAINEDACIFDKVIAARRNRDKASTGLEKIAHESAAQEALVQAIEVPLRIAEASTEVASLGAELFRDGFKSARGDSRTAVELAVASVGGSLGAVSINLTRRKLRDDWWIRKRSDSERLWSLAIAERAALPPFS